MIRMMMLRLAVVLTPMALVGLLVGTPTTGLTAEPNLHIAPASDEAARAMAGFRVPPEMKAELWAAEPLLANPVAFDFDVLGRCYVVETFRLHNGATDNRSHMYWLDDDVASRTVDDRVAMYHKHLKGKLDEYGKYSDRIRLLKDTTGDGVADQSTVFSDGFNDLADGIASGVLARNGDVYFANIPSLHKLRDTTGDDVANQIKTLSTGYGVHVAFLGHDLHGLVIGPDGRIYFSLGDRGLNVTNQEGKKLFYPDTGAVLRCEPDGSHLEVYAYGLRNPQELAFDQYGRLFTGDNNCDSGDKSRWVDIVQGGDSGWRMYYQYPSTMSSRGPWDAEKIWHLAHPEQPAHIVPPVAHVGDGPSGLCAYPGVGLSNRYKDHFFLCDFRGNAAGSGVWSLTVEPKGASFAVKDLHQFIWSICNTDCTFGPDGAFYILDWISGWGKPGKGRIYRFTDPEQINKPDVVSAAKLLAEGFTERDVPELVRLLKHPHMGVRREAQFALVDKKAVGPLTEVALNHDHPVSRLHGIWGLGQLARQGVRAALAPINTLLADADSHVRVQTIDHLGASPERLIALLADPEPRVRLKAATALGQRITPETETAALDAVSAMLTQNADEDGYLRHGGVMALMGMSEPALRRAARDDSPAIRLAALLAMRRRAMPDVAEMLSDPEPRLVIEAARAIHDERIEQAMPALADVLNRRQLSDRLGYRVLNAHYRLGERANADALAQFAARESEGEPLRLEAMRMLGEWAKPGRRDRITGMTQSLPERSAEDAKATLRAALGGIMSGPPALRQEAVKVAAQLGITEIGPELFALARNPDQPTVVRVQALEGLEALKDTRLGEAVESAVRSDLPLLRAAGRNILAKSRPDEVLNDLQKILANSETPLRERQAGLRTLANIDKPASDELLAGQMAKLLERSLPPEVHLELLEASQARAKKSNRLREQLAAYQQSFSSDDSLAAYRESLHGGDAEAGRQIFLYNAQTYCLRCHKVEGTGGEVGPPMDGIGSKQNREYLLESIVHPDVKIAEGYQTVVLFLLDGRTVTGVLREETPEKLVLLTAEGKRIEVPTAEIDEREKGKSAMPEDLVKHLSRGQLRDLVEFLASLKATE